MNYSSFCEYLLAALTNQMEHGVTISKESIRKNNNVSLDAFIIHMPNVSSAPVVYLQPLYQTYCSGSSIDKIAQTVLAKLKRELPLSLELAEQARTLESARDRIAYRLISKKENEELLKEIPWTSWCDLAIIYYLHLGVKDDRQITTIIHNNQAEKWNLSPSELYELAKENTPKLCPSTIGRLHHLIFGWDEDEDRMIPCDTGLPTLYVLSNQTGINGAVCMLYENVIKDFADTLDADLIILPSSIHEVLIVPDSHDKEYEMFRNMVRSVNAEDVPKEEVLSDELYLYRRGSSGIIRWKPCDSDNTERRGTENL